MKLLVKCPTLFVAAEGFCLWSRLLKVAQQTMEAGGIERVYS